MFPLMFFGRGIDIEKINLAINYDLPNEADQYLHRVGRAGRFGTKGLAVSFVSSKEDEEVLERFKADLMLKSPSSQKKVLIHLLI